MVKEGFGVAGGEPGALGRNAVERADGSVEELSGTDKVEMRPGDIIVIESPGGGGYGPAAERAEPAERRQAAE